MSDDYHTNLSFLVFISPKNLRRKIDPIELPKTPIVRNKSISQSKHFFQMRKFHPKFDTRIKTLPKNIQLSNIDSIAVKGLFYKKNFNKILTPRRKKIEIDKINRDKVRFIKISILKKLCILPRIDYKFPGSDMSVESLFLKEKKPRLDESGKMRSRFDDFERY